MRPELRGKPVGVAPMQTQSTCCIAASYEAKKYGVKTGTMVSDAYKLCPEITIVPARPPLYTEIHHMIVNLVESCIHVDHVLSIDEMLCWLPYNWRTEAKVKSVAEEIKHHLTKEFEGAINTTIGVAPNGWLAKMASKMKKPNGFMIIDDADLPEVLYDLELIDLHGIGKSLEFRLHAHGIHTVEDLCQASLEQLRGVWGGVAGALMWRKLRGQAIDDVITRSQAKSMSHGHVLPPDMRSPKKAITVIHRLLQKVAFRARANGYRVGVLELHLRYINKLKWSDSMVFTPTGDMLLLTKRIKELWNRRSDRQSFILQANIVLHHLVAEASYTPSLFEREDTRCDSVNQAVDSIIRKFGKNALYYGGAHGAMETAQPKIAFQHIPNLEHEK